MFSVKTRVGSVELFQSVTDACEVARVEGRGVGIVEVEYAHRDCREVFAQDTLSIDEFRDYLTAQVWDDDEHDPAEYLTRYSDATYREFYDDGTEVVVRRC